MDFVHLHLVLTHLPIAGVIFGLVFIAISTVLNRGELLTGAMVILIMSSLLTIPLYITGEGAEDAIEHLAGVSEMFIEQHEDSAKLSFLLMEGLGLFAAVGLAFQVFKGNLHRSFSYALLLGTLITTASVAWTSNLGGKIRHSEIRSSSAVSSYGSEQSHKKNHDDDD
ncbi:MAG: hypothetical protein KDD66_02050 [Bdellovibrionales bacterium]|nr:hypothetical protein [Bdellovibrionales bacterium]